MFRGQAGPPAMPPPAAAPAPGEFTGLFRPSSGPQDQSNPGQGYGGQPRQGQQFPGPQFPPGPAGPPKGQPESFTSMFRPPAGPAPDPWQFPQGGSKAAPFPGESGPPKPRSSEDFDRFFENPYESNQGAMESKLRSDSPAFQDRPAPKEEGDFTHLFGGNAPPAGPPVGATGVFAGPQAPPQQLPPQTPAGPSEYTQWMKRPAAAAPAPEAPAAAAPAAATPVAALKKGPNWILIVLIAVAVLLVIGIVVLLILNK